MFCLLFPTLQFDLSHVHTVILDECDELLRGSMRAQVELILSQVPDTSQLICVSATVSDAVVKFARARL